MAAARVTWYRVCFDHAVTHLVPGRLLRLLIADLGARDCPVTKMRCPPHPKGTKNPDVVTEWAIDMPGIMARDRPVETLRWAGLNLEIPSEDVLPFRDLLNSLRTRQFVSPTKRCVRYLKLHGFHRCIVMTPAQAVALVKVLSERTPEAERRAAEFYKNRKTAAEILHEAQPHAAGIDLGGHKNDRFRRKGA